jgi:hypothetical protein
VLVEHMPRDSALARELHGEAAEWSVTDHLIAHAVDQLREANWMFSLVNRDEDDEPPEYPEPFPRPGTGTSPQSQESREPLPLIDAAEARKFFS